MRNFVAKNDFNRASVHEDKKKAWEPEIEDGLDEYEEDISSNSPGGIAQSEYLRGVKDSGVFN